MKFLRATTSLVEHESSMKGIRALRHAKKLPVHKPRLNSIKATIGLSTHFINHTMWER